MNKFFQTALAVAAAPLLAGLASAQQMKVDQELPSFQPTAGATYEGRLNAVGSDTMINSDDPLGRSF